MRCRLHHRLVLLTLLLPAVLLTAAEERNPAELTKEIGRLHEAQRKLQAEHGEWSRQLANYGSSSELGKRGDELDRREGELAFEGVSLQARREATKQQIALLEKKVQEALASDQLLTALQEHLKQDGENLEKLAGAGRAGSLEAGNAVVQMRLQVAKRQDEVAAHAGRQIIQRLNAELIDMVIREAELEAQRRYLAAQQKQLEPARTALREIETRRDQMILIRTELSRLNQELLQRQFSDAADKPAGKD